MSSFERFAALIQCCEATGTAFAKSSALATRSRAAPPIPNATTEAVPRTNFLIIVISRIIQVSETADLFFTTLLVPIAFLANVSKLSQPEGMKKKE
jgi:hypothetical protein